jgi:cytoskeletal protein CcmA (bactofilin family)
MFDIKPKNLTDILGKTNRIVEGTTLKGDIISPADFRLDGHLIGNFQTDGKIVVGPAGSVTGNITCRNADIEGRFEGKILVSELLNLKSTSKIKGEVFCEKLSVEPGADFDATCTMKSQKQNLLENGKPRIEEKK